MGGSVEIDYITTSDNNKNGDKQLLIGLDNNEVVRLNMYEQLEPINPEEYIGKLEYEIPYCIASPYNGLGECSKLFNNNIASTYAKELDNYVVTSEGSSCTSLTFRPGSILNQSSDWISNRIFYGNKCKIIYRGPPIYLKDLEECCTGKRTENCHPTINNNFTTSHCNVTMQSYCKSNPNDLYCYRWLESQTNNNNDIALKTYADICSNDHTMQVCSYFCMYARSSEYPYYCDKALKTWCNNNTQDSRCFCFATPSILIPDAEQVLGPKECWLSACTSDYTDQKWLSTSQLQVKQSCSIQSCIITLAKLQSSGTGKISLLNNCVANANSQTEVEESNLSYKSINVNQTWGSALEPYVFLLVILALILLLLSLYKYYPNINFNV